jgi:tetraacyldisaccharide 4'-kinase
MTLNKRNFPPKVVAFCGIGNPDKFFNSLETAGIKIVAQKAFADHYSYTSSDLENLREMAASYGGVLVTTEKDWVRLNKKDQKDILPLAIDLKWKNWGDIEKLFAKKIPG